MAEEEYFSKLRDYLARVPAIAVPVSFGVGESPAWWAKFRIDVTHSLAWNVVQELGFVLNHLSVNDRLPTVFKPISPPPYLNGGPREYLSWVIESLDPNFEPRTCAAWLEGRLPRPVDDLSQWADE